MNIEEVAFKDRAELAHLNELDLLEIIEFLQNDRKQWINQFTQTHNDYVDLQQENKQLKIQISAREEVCNRLESNWNKLKECIKECLEAIDTIQKLTGNAIENYTPRILTYRQILDKMKELEGSSSNEI